ncbi:hypothetical protein Hanom_Chr04g00346341 [Helianthus anomalus]
MALEDCFREIKLLHRRMKLLVVPPKEPIWPQGDWNLANEVIQPTAWDVEIQEPLPINVAFEDPINPTPLPQEEVDEEPFILLPREIEEMLNDL